MATIKNTLRRNPAKTFQNLQKTLHLPYKVAYNNPYTYPAFTLQVPCFYQ